MQTSLSSLRRRPTRQAFTLVEMLVVIAIISILMTVGSVGLSSLGGKGVTSGVASAESLFDEARSTAVGKGLRTAVLVSKNLTNNSAEDLRRIIVATEPVNASGQPTTAPAAEPAWVLTSRGAVLPEQTFFSAKYSKENHQSGSGDIDSITLSGAKAAYAGEYYIYRFNAQGICTTPGTSFIIGSGGRTLSKPANQSPPRVTGSAKRDFGGFIIWRNGRTSVFRSPDQMKVPDSVTDF